MKKDSKPAKEKSLKDQNNASLIAILITNLAVFVVVLKTGQLLVDDYQDVLKQWQSLIPASLGAILIGVVNGLLSAETKARLVFWRWKNPLPGSEAFSRYVHSDPRIDVSALRSKVGTFPTDAREQNALWYKLYKATATHPSVEHAHRLFLLTRDYAGMAIMLLIVFGAIGFFEIAAYKTALFYTVALLIQYLAASLAARNYGTRFVNTVLALKASE